MKNNSLRKNSEYSKYRQINKSRKNSNKKQKNFFKFVFLIFLVFIAIFCFIKFNFNKISNVNNEQLSVNKNSNDSQVVENKVVEPISFSLSAIGDIMCHNSQYMDAYVSSTDSYDFSYVFEDIKDYIQSADIAIGNLETTFAGKEVRL